MWINQHELDIIAIQEINLYWPKVSDKLQFNERIRGWWPRGTTNHTFSYNRHWQPASVTQWGGTAMISRNQAAFRVVETGIDPRKLGRWVWTLYRGKDNKRLRVISAYRPCANKSAGTKNVYSQQRRYFNELGKNWDPRKALLQELEEVIKGYHEDGENVILIMDCNEDVFSKNIQTFLKSCDLKDAIVSKHISSEGRPPATYEGGTKTIDGIFASVNIQTVQAGFGKFTEGVLNARADHRCLWIDIELDHIFGHTMPPIARLPSRRMNLTDPRVWRKFNAKLKEYITKHDLGRRATTLLQKVSYPLHHTLAAEAELLDDLKVKAVKFADLNCRKLYTGKIPYSPTFTTIKKRIQFWKAIIRKKGQRKVNSRYLQRLAKKAKITTPLKTIKEMLTIEDCKARLHDAFDAYKTFAPNAREHRNTWYMELATARAAEDEASQQRNYKKRKKGQQRATAAQLRQIITTEKARVSAQRIQFAIKKNRIAGTTLVIENDTNGQPVERTTKEDIERACVRENIRKYSQTQTTPPMTAPANRHLGYLGTSALATNVLNGTYETVEGNDIYLEKLLQALHQPSYLSPVTTGLSVQEYQDGWKKAKEKTSSHGFIHFSHYKAMAKDSTISQWDSTMLNIAMQSGYTYNRWKRCTDVELLKKANSFHVSKLRTIVLFEADFNFMNKTIAKKAMKNAEANHTLAPEQYGSRKKHRAIEHALNKCLTMDLLRQRRQPGILCTNDLKSCYDRIVHSIASLCLQRVGIPRSEVQVMFHTLQNLTHHVRTAFGDSEIEYGGDDWIVPLQGIYQGNGAGPTIWAVVSSPLMDIMRKEGFGINVNAPLSKESIRMIGYAFVDDTDLVQTGKNAKDALDQMQKAVTLWEGLVRATGGGLVVEKEKSSWWLIDFDHKPDGSWCYKASSAQNPLKVRNFDGTLKPMQQLQPHQSFETLGVFMAPNGQQDTQFDQLLQKTNAWASNIRSSYLTGDDALQALQTTISKTIDYTLPALSLTKEQSKTLLDKPLNAILPKSRINRKFPRKAIHASEGLLGLGIPDVYNSQVAAHADMLLRHGGANTPTGRFLRASLEYCKLELGMSGAFFQKDFRKLGPLLTDCWVKHVWKEQYNTNVLITEQSQPIPCNRIHDQLLMDVFVEADLSRSQLIRLNRCRLMKRVLCVSDITTGDGITLQDQAFSNVPFHGHSQLDWPNQGTGHKLDWRLWRRILIKCLCLSSTNMTLKQRLGEWITDTTCTAVLDIQNSRVAVRIDKTTWQWFSHSNWFLHTPMGLYKQPPRRTRHTLFGHGWVENSKCKISGWTKFMPPQDRRPVPTTLDQVYRSLQPEEKWCIEYLEFLGPCQIWKEAVKAGVALAVTDGSLKHEQGSAAFILVAPTPLHSTTTFDTFLQGACRTTGEPKDQSSYRSELTGILGILTVCHMIMQLDPSWSGSLTIALDNLAAGRRGLEWNTYPSPSEDHFDILRAIHNLRRQLNLTIRFRHVAGHQREKGLTLDIWGLLNDKMDALAKAYLKFKQNNCHPSTLKAHPHEWAVICNNVKICRHLKKRITQTLADNELIDWWVKTKKFTKRQIQLMDVQAITTAISREPNTKKRWISKMAFHFAPTGRNMRRWQFWKTDACPRCGKPNEDTKHVWQCDAPSTSQCKTNAVQKFEGHLQTIGTRPEVKEALVHMTRIFLGLTSHWHHSLASDKLNAAIHDQTLLSWEQFMLGRVVTTWRLAQGDYTTKWQPFLNSKNWIPNLVRGIWHLSHTLWLHRNEILFSKEVSIDKYDMKEVDRRIRQEWKKGAAGLLRIDRTQFNITLRKLLRKPDDEKREWLAYITQARFAAEKLDG